MALQQATTKQRDVMETRKAHGGYEEMLGKISQQ